MCILFGESYLGELYNTVHWSLEESCSVLYTVWMKEDSSR